MNNAETARRAAQWVNSISTQTVPRTDDADEHAERVATCAAILADEFPIEAFTQRSRMHILKTAKFFPTAAELITSLSEWWLDNRPRPTALTGPAHPDALTPADEGWIRFYWARHPAAMAREDGIRASGFTDHAQLPTALLRSLVKAHAPRAYAQLFPPAPRQEHNPDAVRETVGAWLDEVKGRRAFA